MANKSLYFSIDFVAFHQSRPSDLAFDGANGPYLQVGDISTTTSKYALEFGKSDPGQVGDNFDYAEFTVGYTTFTKPAEFGSRGTYETEYGQSSYAIWHIAFVPDVFLLPSDFLGNFDVIVDGIIDDLRNFALTSASASGVPLADVASQLNTPASLFGVMSDHVNKQMGAINDVIDGSISLEIFDRRTTLATREFVLDLAGVAGVPAVLVAAVKNAVVTHVDTADPANAENSVVRNSGGGGGFWPSDVSRSDQIGSAGADHLTDNLGEGSVLAGGAGSDLLTAYGRDSTLSGGGGVDTIEYRAIAGPLDVLSIRLADHVATDASFTDQIIGFENVIGSQGMDQIFGDDVGNDLIGQDGHDVIFGGAGDDWITGGKDDDYLNGGDGVDTARFNGNFVDLLHDPIGVRVDLTTGSATGDGIDYITEIENIVGSPWGDTIVGSVGVNLLQGADGDDLLIAKAGPDGLAGGGGNDFIYGGFGDDIVRGGPGRDYLSGSKGADTFVFASISDSLLGVRNRDVIADFDRADTVDLSRIDADVNRAGNNSFLLTGRSFLGDAGNIRISEADVASFHQIIVQGDVNGDGIADFSIEILSDHRARQDDFVW